MFQSRLERAAFLVLSCSLIGIVAGCGSGSDTPSVQPSITAATDAGVEQTFGDIRTRIVGTAQQPVVSAAPGATVIGIAGATISDITQSSGNRTLLASKIVFSSIRDGNYEIYSMNSDDTSQIRLTNNTAEDTFPSYSADGNKIVFNSIRDGNYEIYSMNSDGTGQIRLTNNTNFDYLPSYSPDGNKIVFLSGRDGNFQIYSMNSDG
ncbi:MAG: PD40 domain-containing protein, partial [Armatimonadetes bacterium]|nr:PD40 domain-containing protein [Armatimonadota bacterium]